MQDIRPIVHEMFRKRFESKMNIKNSFIAAMFVSAVIFLDLSVYNSYDIGVSGSTTTTSSRIVEGMMFITRS